MNLEQSNIDRIVDEIMKVVEHCEAKVAESKRLTSPCCGAPTVEVICTERPFAGRGTGIRCCLACDRWSDPTMPEDSDARA